ncbi:hypothetical protein PoB_001433800 [Plakobranchus ocellatus]|uniref:Uncharacterized protein n=1 Tax=Plakobranchus ocellatus TaxID=259542 RepID=A0AAV3Z012_9GAST|nr:hypothetical protein PoB_001433800 [Plakobranchus ocellatus]
MVSISHTRPDNLHPSGINAAAKIKKRSEQVAPLFQTACAAFWIDSKLGWESNPGLDKTSAYRWHRQCGVFSSGALTLEAAVHVSNNTGFEILSFFGASALQVGYLSKRRRYPLSFTAWSYVSGSVG